MRTGHSLQHRIVSGHIISVFVRHEIPSVKVVVTYLYCIFIIRRYNRIHRLGAIHYQDDICLFIFYRSHVQIQTIKVFLLLICQLIFKICIRIVVAISHGVNFFADRNKEIFLGQINFPLIGNGHGRCRFGHKRHDPSVECELCCGCLILSNLHSSAVIVNIILYGLSACSGSAAFHVHVRIQNIRRRLDVL